MERNNCAGEHIREDLAGRYGLSGTCGRIAGGTKPVTWCGYVTRDNAQLDVGWQWAEAAYSNLNTFLGAIGVKSVESKTDSSYNNSDSAGTPENYKST